MERRSTGWFGFLGGIGVGLAVAGAVWLVSRPSQSKMSANLERLLNQQKLYASATHGGENMTMATARMDDETEGLFVLDHLTGDLQCFVINPRTGHFGARFLANVRSQISGQGKAPKYLMVTGATTFSAGRGGGTRPADCVVYIGDANSGKVVCLGVPWSDGLFTNAAGPIEAQMIPIDEVVVRKKPRD